MLLAGQAAGQCAPSGTPSSAEGKLDPEAIRKAIRKAIGHLRSQPDQVVAYSHHIYPTLPSHPIPPHPATHPRHPIPSHPFPSQLVSLTSLVKEMGLAPGASTALGRFIRKAVDSPRDASVLQAYAVWSSTHQPPAEQFDSRSMKPRDYGLNLMAHAAAHLTGTPHARLRSFIAALGAGELNQNGNTIVKPALSRVLEGMVAEDAEHVLETVLLSGDLLAGFDAFHGQNRLSLWAVGNFTSHAHGFVLMIKPLNKKTKEHGLDGVSQRGYYYLLLTTYYSLLTTYY